MENEKYLSEERYQKNNKKVMWIDIETEFDLL